MMAQSNKEKKLIIELRCKRKDELIFIFAICAVIAILEGVALHLGFNGQILRATTMLIAVTAGIGIGRFNINKLKELI